ncbi:hypothetical protein BD626DRAFT_421677 [Schizophyllum amplum]|uniref:Uncharacterized protein n=1 Tax=Schizophyllum amplum TaxID=97359 RepID=A0A550CXB2_9AGAR|nr:hypothetical protein BD626DRAFT_421677 [Auriculariopsis ampla]
MASKDEVNFNAPHPPAENALEAFGVVEDKIKAAILESRHHWDQHEPRMWSRAQGLSDDDLVNFTLKDDLVQVSSGPTTYGTIILGKIRIPAINDALGEGFVHVRIHDPPNRGTEDVLFHSLWTDEVRPDLEAPPTEYHAVQTADKPLEFFNE